jgi:hypothetical protein
MRSACAILSSVACLDLENLYTLSHKWHDIMGKVSEYKMCVLISSTNFCFATFFVLKRTEGDRIKNVYWSSLSVLLHRAF